VDAYVDALDVCIALINSSAIVGADKPLAGGAVETRPRSPGSGAIAVVTWIASPWEPSEAAIHNAVLSCSVYGTTDANARRGAVALANLLRGIDGNPIPFPALGAALDCVEQITGPSLLPGNEYAYLVDAVCNLQPM
jgi:hypothetical protein